MKDIFTPDTISTKIINHIENKYKNTKEKVHVSNILIQKLGQKYTIKKYNVSLFQHIQNQLYLYIKTLQKEEKGEISKYTIIHIPYLQNNTIHIAIRSFIQNNKQKYLVLNTNTLETGIIYTFDDTKIPTVEQQQKTQYYKFLEKIKKNSITNKTYQNHGLNSIPQENTNHKPITYLTVDLCPSSKKGFEKEMFEKFIESGHKHIGIAITESRFVKHKKDFYRLQTQEKLGKLNITWINHTKTHKYTPGIEFSKNFILSTGIDIHEEIEAVEKLLIENGETPSIYMRFPGLVSDKKTRKTINEIYGLISLGSDAWLAKGEIPKKGSIILIHGNKNESKGIEIINKYIDKNIYTYTSLSG